MELDTHELAWAAGFFDGEGHISVFNGSGHQLVLEVAQSKDPTTLHRFQKALGGLGRILGPYQYRNPRSKPYWKFTAASFEVVQTVVAMLWKYLSDPKKEQAAMTLLEYKRRPRKNRKNSFKIP